MSTARERLLRSLTAIVELIDGGGIQDTALPGTSAAEATRLLKNGLSVSAFACFEHFFRERTHELLRRIAADPDLPPFSDLPEALQTAATRGVVEALRFRLNQRGESVDVTTAVALVQDHAAQIVSTASSSYSFSSLAFGSASSNVGAGTLNDFLVACGAPQFTNEIDKVLKALRFDFIAAGLSGPTGSLRLARFAAWRHEAAHDATISIDVQILRTRVTAYLSIALAFDLLASTAVATLVGNFTASPPAVPAWSGISIEDLTESGTQWTLLDGSSSALGTYYSPTHCRQTLPETELPMSRTIVVRDTSGHAVDWFFA